MECPKCGHEQLAGDVCESCGVLFDKTRQAAPGAPLPFTYVQPGESGSVSRWVARGLAALVLVGVAALVFGVPGSGSDRQQYEKVLQGVNLFSSQISVALQEYWMSNGKFPESNEDVGLPAADGGAWPVFRSVTLTPDGRVVFRYEPDNEGEGEPFTLVILSHPADPPARWARLCGGSNLRRGVRSMLANVCAWDPNISTYAPPQVAGATKRAAALAEAAAPASTYDAGFTPLMLAVNQPDPAEARRLLATPGTPVDARDNEGNTALMYAARNRDPELVRALLDAGADPLLANAAGRNAWFWAGLKRNVPGFESQDALPARLEVLRILLERGVPVDTLDADAATLLHYAASESDVPLLEFLLAQGASLAARDGYGKTPLLRAVVSRVDDAALTVLIQRGASVRDVDAGGMTALMALQKQRAIKGADLERRFLALRAAGAS